MMTKHYVFTNPDETWNRYINISGDGRHVIFCSGMPDLVVDDNNGVADTFIYDAATAETTLVSRNWKGPVGDNHSEAWHTVSLSHDGRYAVFSGEAANLVPRDTFIPVPEVGAHNRNHDTFFLDRDTDDDGVFDEAGATGLEMITLDNDGKQLGGGWDPMVTDNGRKVIFGTFMPFDPLDTNGDQNDAYVRDRSIPLVTVTKAVYTEKKERLRVLAESDPTAGKLRVQGYGLMTKVRETNKRIFWELKANAVASPPAYVTAKAAKAWMSLPVKVK